MSTLSRFKWQRAKPPITATRSPGYASYNLQSMKQIPILLGAAGAGGPSSPVITAYVPANSWAQNKLLLIRGYYILNFPAGAPVPGYNITENWNTPQIGGTAFPIPAAFLAAAGTFTTTIERCFIRQDPDIVGFDRGDTMQFNFANFYDAISHITTGVALTPPIDYTVEIPISLEFQLPGTFPGATITAMWAEAFLEQALNLGRLS